MSDELYGRITASEVLEAQRALNWWVYAMHNAKLNGSPSAVMTLRTIAALAYGPRIGV
jgi:hypothetical protein